MQLAAISIIGLAIYKQVFDSCLIKPYAASTKNPERNHMKIKLQVTLSSLFITLFFNNVYAENTTTIACNQALAKGDITAALATADKTLKNNKNDKDALICQGRALSERGDLNAALAAFKLADAQSSDAFDKTIIVLLTGHAYKAAQQYDQAIANYQLSITNAKAANNQAFQRIGQNAIGNVYFETKQYPLALTAYLAGNKLTENDNERGESYERIALTYHNMNQHDLALEFQVKAYIMHQSVGTLDQLAHSSIEMGRYYALVKNYVSAENALNKIINFAKEQGGAYYEAQGSCVLAQVKLATGDTAAAKALIEHAKSIAKSTNDSVLDKEIDQETQHMF